MISEKEKAENKSKYCSNGDAPCSGICIGLRVIKEEDVKPYRSSEIGTTRFSACEKYIADTYNAMGIPFPTSMMQYRHPVDYDTCG